MPVLTINRNRLRKVYPGIRKTPVYTNEVNIEGGEVTLTDGSEGTYTFTLSYKKIPAVTATAVDSASNGQADVNVYISSISLSQVTVNSSAAFTGKIYVQVVAIK